MRPAPATVVTGALIGVVPGLMSLGVNAAFVDGEAQLTLGVIGLFLVLFGALAGAAYASRRATPPQAGAVAGALLGTLPGLLLYRLLPGHPVAVAAILAGAGAGALLWWRHSGRRPPQAH